ncbi:type III secretion system effector protein exou [Pseudomonas sp. ADAK18]|uniref:patatin-like phospholipase family protein n=1 Tax=Pseudomonas sp. ADAK18 TaxID=2730848 RepID=UPI0014646A4A|nr:patatin-like phospholipase family protein [Pseudomonas sp. ADAK18]QJI31526.1 type III secretion system effector protein exou [Pseudomonas sp. ADAK18]
MKLLNPAPLIPPSLPQGAQGAQGDANDIIGSGLATALGVGLAPVCQGIGRSAALPQGAAIPLVERAGERKLTLSRYSNGAVDVALSPPPITQLVLSGGGAKGVAYSGVLQALEDKNALKDVRVISGSSAGGISAAVLASGMSAKAFDYLLDNLDLPDLLNSRNAVLGWLQNASSTLGKVAGHLPGQVGSLSQLLFTLLPRLQSKAEPLEQLVRDESRKAILAHIADTPRDALPAEVMAIADKLSAGGATTFADLNVLSRHIPVIKQLNITGTAMFDGRPQLVVFNASLTPDMDIARAAHISGSLPVVFKAPKEQGHGFQEHGECTSFQDGGLMLNTPVADFYQRRFPACALSSTEQLILKFDEDQPAAVRGGIGGALADKFLGVSNTANNELMSSKLKALKDQTVIVPLKTKTGDFSGMLTGTINFTMPNEVKDNLQELSRVKVDNHLERRAEVREHHQFDSIDSAVLAMDEQMLASVRGELVKEGSAANVLRFRMEARQGLEALDKAIISANTGDRLEMTPQLSSALRNLDAVASRPEYVEWLGARLNDAGKPAFQQLLQTPHQQPTKVLLSGIAEMKRHDVAVIAENFTREVIYPSLFRVGQPDVNVALLRRAEQDMTKATTPAEFNQVLDNIIENYAARNKPWVTALNSTTIEMAKAWRLPDKSTAPRHSQPVNKDH